MRIGVIGLGAMGRGISARLLQAGHEVLVWNRSPSAADDVVAKGAVRVGTPVQAAQDDIVLSILFDDAAIRDTLVDGGVLAKASADCTHVCLSTVSLPFAVELEKLHADIGLRYVAAPMLGRPEVVERGALNMLVGGDPTVVKRVEAVLANIGHVYRIGDVPHEAQAAKLAANFMISGAIDGRGGGDAKGLWH
jgi:3-hydroxyisobutyrate dehydrogenase-like beta-hydroxyacid dehydrogenase